MNKAPRENIWNLPNLLTMLRMAMIALFLHLFAMDMLYGALAVYLLAFLTDVLDGYIARKRNLITSFGKLMDPLADKLMLITALAALLSRGWVPVWVLVVIVAKELFMVWGGMALLRRRKIVVQADRIGKLATGLFMLAVVATFLHPYLAPVDYILQCAAVAVSLLAMVHYTIHALRNIPKQDNAE